MEQQARIYIRRLERLRDVVLPRIPRKGLEMSVWARRGECGTVACALGWAGLDSSFKKAGLITQTSAGIGLGCVSYKRHTGLDAAEKFFGIDSNAAYRLFIWPNTRREVKVAINNAIRELRLNLCDRA